MRGGEPPLPRGRLSRRLDPPAERHPPGARDPRSLRPRGRRCRRHGGPGSTTATGRSSRAEAKAPYAFLGAEATGASLHQIPVGPVHAGIIEPGHFRFHANGETVVRLEARLGYIHKGIEALMVGRSPAEAARFAGPALRRQHRRPCPRLRPRGGGSARHRGAGARPMAARADGRAGAPGQSFRRYRRDLQRRDLSPAAGAVLFAARGGAAGVPRPASAIA